MTAKRIQWIGVGGLLVLACAWWMLWRPATDDPRRGPPPAANVAAPTPVAHRSAAAGQKTERPAICMDQRIDITADGRTLQQCLGTTHSVRNGSILTYRADPQNPDGQWLNVEAGGKVIFGAQIGSGGRIDYQCQHDQCAGIAIGPYDSQGARSIILTNATLFRDSAAHPGEQETALITGRMSVLPDDQSASTTCVEQVLLINAGDETVHFCPDSGTGFDLDADGGRTYKFTNGDGTSVAVDTDPRDALRRVEYNGYSCTAQACSGVSVSAPEPSGARHFSFRGTLLVRNGTDTTSALLNGNLILDPQ